MRRRRDSCRFDRATFVVDVVVDLLVIHENVSLMLLLLVVGWCWGAGGWDQVVFDRMGCVGGGGLKD